MANYEEYLGKYGRLAEDLSRQHAAAKSNTFRASLLSAVTFDRVVANQLIEGPIDASLFENFLHHTLAGVRADPELQGRQVVVLMDNARIHSQELVLAAAARFRAVVVFNAQYSPQLNPVEHWFQRLKYAFG